MESWEFGKQNLQEKQVKNPNVNILII